MTGRYGGSMHRQRSRLWGLDPEVVHLNHGSFGATPIAVLEYQHALQRHIEANPTAFELEELQSELDRTRAVLAAFVNGDPAGIALIPNTTYGVNTALRSLDFGEGDEILLTDHSYGACRNAAAYVAARTGASLVVAELPDPVDEAGAIVSAIMDRVTTSTKLALLDHVTSSTALILPIAEIVGELRRGGVMTLVDGAHAPGMIPVDLAGIGADVYVANCHKWLCAPKGAAFLAAAPDIRERLVPLAVSFGYTAEGTEGSRFHAMFDWTGTDDPTAHLSVPRALEVVAGAMVGGWSEVMRHNHDLAITGRRLAHEVLGEPIVTPASLFGSMAAIPLPDMDGGAVYTDPLQTFLREKHDVVIPVTPGPRPRQRWLRLSAQIYNDVDDYERLANALEEWNG